jgi:hypothetical protein
MLTSSSSSFRYVLLCGKAGQVTKEILNGMVKEKQKGSHWSLVNKSLEKYFCTIQSLYGYHKANYL